MTQKDKTLTKQQRRMPLMRKPLLTEQERLAVIAKGEQFNIIVKRLKELAK